MYMIMHNIIFEKTKTHIPINMLLNGNHPKWTMPNEYVVHNIKYTSSIRTESVILRSIGFSHFVELFRVSGTEFRGRSTN